MTTLRDEYAPIDACAFVRESVSSAEILHVLGSVDLASTVQFEDAIACAVRRPRPLVIDLTECDYFGAAGFSVLVRSHQTLGPALRVAIPERGIPARLFEMLVDDTSFFVAGSIESALHSRRHGKRSL